MEGGDCGREGRGRGGGKEREGGDERGKEDGGIG